MNKEFKAATQPDSEQARDNSIKHLREWAAVGARPVRLKHPSPWPAIFVLAIAMGILAFAMSGCVSDSPTNRTTLWIDLTDADGRTSYVAESFNSAQECEVAKHLAIDAVRTQPSGLTIRGIDCLVPRA